MKVSISGIRGIFGKDLTLTDILQFSRRFSQLIDEECVMARDTRLSSKIIYETASAALMEQGVDVYNLGIAPTPFAFKEAKKHGGAALIVTASHNPVEWNGLRFVRENRTIFEDELEKIKNLPIDEINSIGKEHQIPASYFQGYLQEILDLTGKINEKIKVAVDAAGGAASNYANSILSEIGCTVTSINDKHGNFVRNPDPTYDELSDLSKTITDQKCEAGFAFDLDGDRVVVMDKNGVKLPADLTLLLCIARAIDMKINEFAISIDTSKAVEDYIKNRNCAVSRTKVGEANVVKEMLKQKATAGGEGSSGGFILEKFNMCRDGMLASVLITSLLGTKTYDECITFASQYHTIRGKVEVDSSIHNIVIDNLGKILEKESSSLNNLDGVFATIDDDSWVLIRGSNTEHSIRLSVESKSEERSKSLYTKYDKIIREENEKIKRKTSN